MKIVLAFLLLALPSRARQQTPQEMLKAYDTALEQTAVKYCDQELKLTGTQRELCYQNLAVGFRAGASFVTVTLMRDLTK